MFTKITKQLLVQAGKKIRSLVDMLQYKPHAGAKSLGQGIKSEGRIHTTFRRRAYDEGRIHTVGSEGQIRAFDEGRVHTASEGRTQYRFRRGTNPYRLW